MRLRRSLAAAFSAIPVACSSGQAQISAPRARDAVPSSTSTAPPETVAPDVVEPLPADGGVSAPPSSGPDGQGTTTIARTGPVPANSVARGPLPVHGARAVASWYGDELRGSPTATGEPFDPDGLTFAHRSMAFGTAVRFCGPLGCVVARCNDRGPFVGGRTFDLSRAAFAHIEILSAGTAEVSWEVV